MSNWMHDLFKQDEIQPNMFLVTADHLQDSPILANTIAQFIFGLLEEEELEVYEADIVDHLIDVLKTADEKGFKNKMSPLAQQYDNLISKELH